MLAGNSENIVDEQADRVDATTAASTAAMKQRIAPEKTPQQRRIDTMRTDSSFISNRLKQDSPLWGYPRNMSKARTARRDSRTVNDVGADAAGSRR